MRQVHHWAALLFLAAIVAHRFRNFFTGADRRSRELNCCMGWVDGAMRLAGPWAFDLGLHTVSELVSLDALASGHVRPARRAAVHRTAGHR